MLSLISFKDSFILFCVAISDTITSLRRFSEDIFFIKYENINKRRVSKKIKNKKNYKRSQNVRSF
jgi:hypothetical protein